LKLDGNTVSDRDMKRCFLYLVVFTGLSLTSLAQSVAPDPTALLSNSGKQAYQKLLKADLFAIGGIGYAGQISVGESELDILLKQENAVPAFKQLIQDAPIEVALYGLVGLSVLDSNLYQAEIALFRKRVNRRNETIHTMAGCTPADFEMQSEKVLFFEKIFPKFVDLKIRRFRSKQDSVPHAMLEN
jgi:hypothetical protein